MALKSYLSLSLGIALLTSASIAAADGTYVGHVSSSQYPIRIYYTADAGQAKAQETLGYAETAWQIQVEQMGFTAPTTVDETGQFVQELRIYLDPTLSYDYPEPMGDNPNTPWTDCTTRMFVRSLSSSSYLEHLIAHELNHMLEYAMDCAESTFTFEQTTVAVTTLLEPDEQLFRSYFLPVFQQNPHHGLACTFFYDENKRYYHYGSALFQLFLEQVYGNYDGQLLVSFWNAAKQNGSMVGTGWNLEADVPNDPDIFDAMEAVLVDTTLAELYSQFAQWRYFVGTRDDGTHFQDGSLWTGGEVAIDTVLTLAELPLSQGAPNNPPDELGTVYLELDPYGIDENHGVQINFHGVVGIGWHVEALLVKEDLSAEVRPLTVDTDSAQGELTLEGLTDIERVVLVVSNLGDGQYEADSPSCQMGDIFTFDMQVVDVAIAPTIMGLDPGQVQIGQAEYIWINGSDFNTGLSVEFAGAGIQVDSVDFVDPTVIGVALTVAHDAEPGPRDLTITNPNGKSASLPAALTLMAVTDGGSGGSGGSQAPSSVTTDESPDSSCNLSLTRTAAPTAYAGWCTALLLVALARWRRRTRFIHKGTPGPVA